MAINQYRRHALECLSIADENTTSPESRMLLVGLAQAWLKLARRAEQDPSAELLSETTSPPLAATAAYLSAQSKLSPICYGLQRFNALMSRTYLTFGDIAGKLHMMCIECTWCRRKGRYSVAKLIAQHGHRGNMSLRGDCAKRNATPARAPLRT